MTTGQNIAGGEMGFASQNDPNAQGDIKGQAKRAGDQLADAAYQAGDQARKAASALAAEANERMQGYLDRQVAAGADLVEGVSHAIRVAADELGGTSPMLASAVRSAADTVRDVSGNVRNKRADELLTDARDIVRRKPALVFGAAAGLGFLAFRVLNASVMRDTFRGHDTASNPKHGAPIQPFDGPIEKSHEALAPANQAGHS